MNMTPDETKNVYLKGFMLRILRFFLKRAEFDIAMILRVLVLVVFLVCVFGFRFACVFQSRTKQMTK